MRPVSGPFNTQETMILSRLLVYNLQGNNNVGQRNCLGNSFRNGMDVSL